MPRKKTRERRSWSLEDKQRIIAESEQGSVTGAAERNGISPNLLFIWRKQARDGKLGGRRAAKAAAAAASAPRAPRAPKSAPIAIATSHARSSGQIEIVLANGRRVIVDGSVDAGSLSRVLAALEK